MHPDLKAYPSSPSCHTTDDNSTSHIPSGTPRVFLVGQPNSGKTTLFNVLTGSNFKTSNYPGTTVEFLVGKFHPDFDFSGLLIDSPGINSLHPHSLDEEVAVHALFDHPIHKLPNLVIITADASQLSRQLYLVRQVLDSGFNAVVALTMHDILEKKGLNADVDLLSVQIGCPVVRIDGRSGLGAKALVSLIAEHLYDKPATHIIRPAPQTRESVLDMYKQTEAVERAVIRSSRKPLDINRINQNIFNTRLSEPDANSVRMDKILLHPVFGMILFSITMAAIFTSIFWLAQPVMNLISVGFSYLGDGVLALFPTTSWFGSLLSDGLIAGVGTVAAFVPQIVILFLLMGFLEDSGYLARGAMLIDKPLSKIGLNGRSFVPMLSGFACAIPATLAARTIPNHRERLLTIFIIPLMSCSARLPVYALLLAFLIPPDKPWLGGLVLGGIYILSLINAGIVAGLISRFRKSKGVTSFMLELPAYRRPVLKFILKNTYYRSISYIQKAGLAIVASCVVIWALAYFPNSNPTFTESQTAGKSSTEISGMIQAQRTTTSYAASIGRAVEPLLRPLGWDWHIGVGLISAFVAREVFVSATALTFHIVEDDSNNLQNSLLVSMRDAKSDGKPLFTTSSVIGIIIFFMYAMQCTSTLAVVRKETGSWKIPILQQVVFTAAGYGMALISVHTLHFFGIQ